MEEEEFELIVDKFEEKFGEEIKESRRDFGMSLKAGTIVVNKRGEKAPVERADFWE